MNPITFSDLMNLFRFLDSIKEPTPREKAAAERIREEILLFAEGLEGRTATERRPSIWEIALEAHRKRHEGDGP